MHLILNNKKIMRCNRVNYTCQVTAFSLKAKMLQANNFGLYNIILFSEKNIRTKTLFYRDHKPKSPLGAGFLGGPQEDTRVGMLCRQHACVWLLGCRSPRHPRPQKTTWSVSEK